MNWRFVIVWCSIIFATTTVLSQRFINYSELANFDKDSVIAINLTKGKMKEFPSDLLEYKNLQHLIISKTPLKSVEGIEQLKKLKTLKLDKLDLLYFPKEVTSLVNLEELTISRIEFPSIPSQIGNMGSLRFIDFYGSAITSLPEEIQYLNKLERFDLSGIALNVKEQKAIKELLPNVKVRMDAPCNCMSH